jgi:hypothetical protein
MIILEVCERQEEWSCPPSDVCTPRSLTHAYAHQSSGYIMEEIDFHSSTKIRAAVIVVWNVYKNVNQQKRSTCLISFSSIFNGPAIHQLKGNDTRGDGSCLSKKGLS